MNAPVFTHTPRPPAAASEPAHAQQRWFDGDARGILVWSCVSGGLFNTASVYRNPQKAHALLRIEIGDAHSSLEARLALDPDALRELARRLIDAAHDLEAHPAPEGGAA